MHYRYYPPRLSERCRAKPQVILQFHEFGNGEVMVGLCYLPVNPYDYRAAVEIDGQPDAAAEILNHESAGGVMPTESFDIKDDRNDL